MNPRGMVVAKMKVKNVFTSNFNSLVDAESNVANVGNFGFKNEDLAFELHAPQSNDFFIIKSEKSFFNYAYSIC